MRQRQSLEEVLQRLGTGLTEADQTIKLAAMMLRIRDRSGTERPLQANAAQRQYEHHRGQQNIVLKARQMGITTWICGRFFLKTALRPGTTTLLVAHNQHAAESLLDIVRTMWGGLPGSTQREVFPLRRCNAGEMVFARGGGTFRVASAADVNAGRGLSVQNLHCSEVSRWPGDARATLAGLRAALAPGGELVLESTPMGAYGAFYDEWMAAGEPPGPGARAEGLVRHFFPWWMEPSYVGPPVDPEAMTAEEKTLLGQHGLGAAQIGFRRGLERSYGALRDQEFAEDAETCFRATGACCFDLQQVEGRLGELAGPPAVERNGALHVWLPAIAGRRYLVAVDTAGGGADGDFAALQVLDVQTGMQCAELQERLTPAALAKVSAEVSARYGGAMVAVERNNHGSAVLAYLQGTPGVSLYQQSGQMGWLTTAANKPEMVARLATLLLETPERFFSKRLLGECRQFVLDERGRAGAVHGAHDDLVMAMAVGQAVRAELLQSGR